MVREIKEIEKVEVKEIEKVETPPVEIPQGRQEESYFFPKERMTISASSLQEAIIKLKKIKNND